jgi:hypothetical protein
MQLRYWMAALLVFCVSVGACADRAEPLSALSKMPVKEITVFKDGHTLVLHEGTMPTDANGYVQMDYLPNPVIGTFWPYSNDKNVKLNSVVASPRKVLVTRTALSLRELLESNPGAEVRITQMDGTTIDAKVVGVLTRSSEELEALSPPSSGEKLPEKGNIILLKTAEGVEAFPIETIKAVSFKGDLKRTASDEEFRNLLTLKLDWPNNKPAKTASVGMMYLQKGIRWIPSYKITLDGKGGAILKLQATLLNELTDLDDVTANLVIGVPSFAFKDTADPIALQQAFAQLSSYFSADSRTNYAFSNGLVGQQAGGRAGERLGGQPGDPGANLGPELSGSEKNEDLFVFTVKHLSLKKGQRMVLPITEIALKYQDVYTLDLPFAPPQELRGGRGPGRINEQEAELARMMAAPKALHKIRLTNTSRIPITTAPALILNGDRVLAQGMTTYTAPGGELDLTLTTATDIRVKKSDKETGRTPNAANWNNQGYGRIDLAGTITLINFTDHPVDLEITRNVLGNVGRADHDGKAAMVNVFEDDDYTPVETPAWWNSYSWPDWWSHFNGVGRITWKVHLDAGKTVDLGYTWHYFWR